MKNIVLIGFMGSGKSSTAQELSRRLNRDTVSTDALIEKKEKRTIHEIFRDSGEPYFRQVEKTVVQEVSKKENHIIDCGGGVVLNEDNVKDLKRQGVIIFLSATPEEIFKRVRNETHRPLLKVENPQARIKEMLDIRLPFYQKAADQTIVTNGKTPKEVCEDIIRLIHHD